MLERLPAGVRIVTGDRPEAFQAAAPEAEAILSWFSSRTLLEQVLAMMPRARWVHASSAGVDTLLFPALRENGVVLTNARGAYSDALGEFVVGSILFFAKHFRRLIDSQEAGRWDLFDVEMIEGRTLGIVGYGDIGRASARRAHALGMKILALRRRPELSDSDGLIERAYGPASLHEMLAASDYVLSAAPLTPETRGMIGTAALAAMKPGGVLINVGRGPVVDEAALVEALEGNRIGGAALDVFEQEPLAEGHPFYGFKNVLLSPHCADHVADWRERSMEVFLDNFARFHAGEPLRNIVDKRSGY
jgi:phosphoglycerate dehydrogenase-like enzyme